MPNITLRYTCIACLIPIHTAAWLQRPAVIVYIVATQSLAL